MEDLNGYTQILFKIIMAIIENKTPRANDKTPTPPAITIRETLELSTNKINVTIWAEHLHCDISLETSKRKLSVKLGHDDVLNIYNQTKELLNL